ncbi:hypothetical protein BIFGAL_03393 [Bifidobacterium gallicum DSM 20093 = LMG 11596]|uniref:Uncharacterized protein n=1 Tax=Bifidobacterium gallicum DSM 20093 = LMG 11596 TaxID=561180 RepID=D1NU72_9BIFI|nr:hypothetical protein BIFGAL_03393 [Bifidobacterium gallicum DSM 20093 = LMG 11596]
MPTHRSALLMRPSCVWDTPCGAPYTLHGRMSLKRCGLSNLRAS